MPNNRGTFQGNLAGTGSRILEMLTSSKAVTASYAVTASRLSVNNVGENGQPVYFQNGVPTADTKTQIVVNWVTANSGSISGATGSSAATNIQVKELVDKSGSWESASIWVENNSSSISNTVTKVNNLKGISFATGATRITASYHPTSSSNVIINIPSNPGHIGAASASHTHSFDQITHGTDISASVKSLETSASVIKSTYVSASTFNSFSQSVASEFLPINGGTLTGNLETKNVFISGNLTVGGTTTTIDAQNLNVKDKLILIASGSNTQAAANGAGIAVSTASAGEGGAARIQYLSSGNKFTSSVAFEAPSFTGSLKGTASNAVSASYSTQAGASISASYATSASHAKNSDKATSASYASASTTASYALVAESVKDASGLTVKSADTASYVEWNNVSGHPTFVSATFRTGTFSPATYNPVGSAQTINIPTTTAHITGLNDITKSVKEIVDQTGSWNGVASTASAAYQSASKALATASVAQKEAESASYWKTEASKSAANASTYAGEASGSMEDARLYSSQAANNVTLSSTSAQLAAASASAAASSATSAATYATRAQQSASNAHTSKTLAAASASVAAASASAAATSAATAANWAVSASASANQIQADTTVAANWAASSSKYATNASESAALMYKNIGSTSVPVFMSASVGPVAVTSINLPNITASTGFRGNLVGNVTGNLTGTASYTTKAASADSVSVAAVNTNANLPVLIAAAATPANPGPVKYDTNLTYNASTNRLNVTHVNATGLTGSLRGNVVGNVTGNLTGTASFATSASRAISAASADNATSATTASYALIAEAVKDGAGLVVNTASYALDAAIKFGGHYAPSASGAGASGSSTARYYIKTINVDGKGHVVGVTTGNETVTNTDTKVTSAANHYKATNQISGSQGGTDTTYIHAITLDAAGHVTAVSTTNTSSIKAASATSASYSTYAGNAGQLAGKAASQYALAADYLPLGGGTITGSLTVQKDLVVAGTASYLYTNDLVVKDRLILVSSGSTTQANSDGAGIAIQTASATTVANAEKAAARFQYRSSDNHFTASVGIVAPSFTGSLSGKATSAGSADSATVATGLGVAGNTSASVAAAINAKWTYNEATIKAVKVTSASRADSAASATSATSATKLVGTSGSTSVPVYINAGVPTAVTSINLANITASTGFRGNLTGNVTGTATSASRAVSAASVDSVAWDNVSGKPNRAGSDTDGGSAQTLKGAYTSNGGQQNPNYFGTNKVGVLMMNTTVNSNSQYKDWIIMDAYNGNDVGGAVAFGVNRQTLGAYIMRSEASRSTWAQSAELIGTHNFGANIAPYTSSWASAAANSHTHSNKAVLDGITAADTASWDAKQAAISDLATIRSNATNGNTAYGWGNHASAGYVKSSGVTSIATGTGLTGGPITSTGTMSIAAATLGKIESGSTAFGWGNHANAGYVKSADITSAINALVTASGSKWSTDNDTKVTSAANHYTPTKAGTSGSSTARYYIKTIDVDAKGHVTGVTTGNETVTNTDTKVTAVGNHYTPTQSTAKSVSSGQAVFGVGLDAAGHVVSVTGSNIITSASRATSAASADVATGLGVAANTSASVAAAINTKWTYNEATIKAVKVTSASRADSAASAATATSASRATSAASADSATSAVKLVGTSGSAGIPVYVNAGVPTACQANIVSLPLSSSGATAGTLTLVPGKVHDCGTLTGDLTLALGSDNTYAHEAIYCCVFNMGSTLRTVTLPAGVSVMQNSVDLDTADVYYEINIMNNVAVIARTSAS